MPPKKGRGGKKQDFRSRLMQQYDFNPQKPIAKPRTSGKTVAKVVQEQKDANRPRCSSGSDASKNDMRGSSLGHVRCADASPQASTSAQPVLAIPNTEIERVHGEPSGKDRVESVSEVSRGSGEPAWKAAKPSGKATRCVVDPNLPITELFRAFVSSYRAIFMNKKRNKVVDTCMSAEELEILESWRSSCYAPQTERGKLAKLAKSKTNFEMIKSLVSNMDASLPHRHHSKSDNVQGTVIDQLIDFKYMASQFIVRIENYLAEQEKEKVAIEVLLDDDDSDDERKDQGSASTSLQIVNVASMSKLPEESVEERGKELPVAGGASKDGPFAGGASEDCPFAGGASEDGPFTGGASEDVLFAGGASEDGPVGGGASEDGPFAGGASVDGPFAGGASVDGPFAGGTREDGPFAGGASEDVPFAGGASEDVPFTGGASEDVPFTGGASEDGPFAGGASEDVPVVGGAGEDGPFVGGASEDGPVVGGAGEDGPVGGGAGEDIPAADDNEYVSEVDDADVEAYVADVDVNLDVVQAEVVENETSSEAMDDQHIDPPTAEMEPDESLLEEIQRNEACVHCPELIEEFMIEYTRIGMPPSFMMTVYWVQEFFFRKFGFFLRQDYANKFKAKAHVLFRERCYPDYKGKISQI